MTEPTPRPMPASRMKRLWAKLKHMMLHEELTSHQVALSFGIGFSIAWNPLLGLHTAAILLLCLLFKNLHRPLMFAACFINNPWTMVPIATLSTYLGNLMLGRGLHLDLSGIHWHDIGLTSFITKQGIDDMVYMLKPILGPYLLGGTVLSILMFLPGYYVMLTLTQRIRKLHMHLPHFHVPSLHREEEK